jgi:hypothetical protein
MGAKVEVAAYNETPEQGSNPFNITPAICTGVVIVRGYFDVDPRIILGKDSYGVRIERAGIIEGFTILFVHASLYGTDEKTRRGMIDIVVARIKALLNNPASAFKMMHSNPFPKPKER